MNQPLRRRSLTSTILAAVVILVAGLTQMSTGQDLGTGAPPAPEVKCGCTTCGNPCYVSPPPPPPVPSPPPPVPSPPPPSPPPPAPPKEPNCPPPPAPPTPTYPTPTVPTPPGTCCGGIPLPQGTLYPVDPSFDASGGGRRSAVVVLPAVAGLLLALW